jgi:hypothetical protein
LLSFVVTRPRLLTYLDNAQLKAWNITQSGPQSSAAIIAHPELAVRVAWHLNASQERVSTAQNEDEVEGVFRFA